MSMRYGELEANNNTQNVANVPRKTIALKLKREPQDEPVIQSPPKELKPQVETLNWNYKVKLAGERKNNKINLLNFCEKCKRPILVHGRLIPCKHFLCLSCAQKGTRSCFKCEVEIKGIQPVPEIYVCTHEGTRHSIEGCRKSYLNLHGLAQHQKLRHSGTVESPNVDSDGELSVNKPPPPPQSTPAAPTTQPPQTAPVQTSQYTLPQQLPTSLPTQAVMARPIMFPPIQPVKSIGQPATSQANRMTFTQSAAPRPPTAVLLYPRPQIVTSMTPLLIPPRSLGPPQMLTLPGMLPQPRMMPLPPQQPFTQLNQLGPGPQLNHAQLAPRFPPQLGPQITPSGPLEHPPQIPMPPQQPMPEQMRDVPRRHFSPSAGLDTIPPPPPAPREIREPMPQREYAPIVDQTDYRDVPRDPRKARDVPPPPPPKNETAR